MIPKLRKDLLTWLNAAASTLLAYVLTYPNALQDLKAIAPPLVQPYLPAIAVLWFALIQIARARAVKKAEAPKQG